MSVNKVLGVGCSDIERLYPKFAVTSEVDVAVNTPITPQLVYAVLTNPLTWLPALAYLTTFGFELAIDSNLANILFAIYKSKHFGQTKAGYITSTFGLLNFFTRPAGGFFGDLVYRRWGVPGKKYLMLACGAMQGILCIGLGFYIDSEKRPDLAKLIAFICLVALFNEMGNGANFSLVPHTNACQYLRISLKKQAQTEPILVLHFLSYRRERVYVWYRRRKRKLGWHLLRAGVPLPTTPLWKSHVDMRDCGVGG